MANEFHISVGGETRGPYTRAQLKSMWDQGVITSDAQYWAQGMDDWCPVSGFLASSNPVTPETAEPRRRLNPRKEVPRFTIRHGEWIVVPKDTTASDRLIDADHVSFSGGRLTGFLVILSLVIICALLVMVGKSDSTQSSAVPTPPAIAQESQVPSASPSLAQKQSKERAVHFEEVEKGQEVAQIKDRLGVIAQQISQNHKRAFTPHSKTENGVHSYSNVSSDFDQLMAEDNQLELEQATLQKRLLTLTGEDMRRPSETDNARAAADSYIAALQQQGIVFGSQFQASIAYRLLPAKVEFIYTLEYTNKIGMRVVGPYTFTVEDRGSDGWQVVGSSVGDRRAKFDEPVVNANGVWSRSPMEQTIGEAMGH